jgi:O-antigen ligase
MPTEASLPIWFRLFRDSCFWLLILVLAWAPFPLGSNREWSWSLLTILVSFGWFLWTIWAVGTAGAQWRNLKRLAIPLGFVITTLAWASIQGLPFVPANWIHPLWPQTALLLHRPIVGAISLNPWRTIGEVTKLATYVATTWMIFTLTRNRDRARHLLNAIIIVGALYALYGFALGLLETTQYSLFYSPPLEKLYLPGPFVLHNSFATFEGLAAICAVARLVEYGGERIVASKGFRRWSQTSLKFLFGSGAPVVLATILTVSALIASASRGGAFSTLCAFIAMTIPFASAIRRSADRKWVMIGAGSLALLLLVLVWVSGDTLTGRFEQLLDAGNADAIRVALWAAARRMIVNAPLLGLGLGTFQDAYPMYATQYFPLIMDKAHSDYLEFAAGLGLPAALCWWGAVLWAAIQMGKGVFARRKDRIYPLVGLGATVLVAVHSTVDFSLQMPAVAMSYAAILGIGLAQSYSTQRNPND